MPQNSSDVSTPTLACENLSRHASPNLKKDRDERSKRYSQRQIKTERKELTHFAVYSAISCLLCQNEKSVVHAWSHLWGCEFIKSIYQKINDCTEINAIQRDGCLYSTWAFSKEFLASPMIIALAFIHFFFLFMKHTMMCSWHLYQRHL